ncbi:MAG: heme ABC exporter ATP-binding protein CcmA [Ilumatobacteraceae bacterium]|nr:heme ABC exporter ATP-binding protein CcmA [Ilumatobacteraceae bacterium]
MDFKDVVIVYDNFPAVAGATFSVDAGEIVLLQGPNGAGKTTLLRACAGLLPIARGTANVLGCDLSTNRLAVRSRVGLLGHANGLFQDLTVLENMLFWSRLVGAMRQDVDQAMIAMGISGRLGETQVAKLSAGQRRRCALASLIVRRAQLWLLDEPHAGLDTQGRDELDRTLRAARDAGATVIFASHEIERARSLATRSLMVTTGTVKPA